MTNVTIFVKVRDEILNAILDAIPTDWCVNTAYISTHSGWSKSYVYLAVWQLRREGKINVVEHGIDRYRVYLYCRFNATKGVIINYGNKDYYITYEQVEKLARQIVSSNKN
jgi:hypothetical protein